MQERSASNSCSLSVKEDKHEHLISALQCKFHSPLAANLSRTPLAEATLSRPLPCTIERYDISQDEIVAPLLLNDSK